MSEIIVILGSPNGANGELFSVAKARCEQAISLWWDNPESKILLTGGFGDHFNTTTQPHAAYLNDYLIASGIPSDAILEFALSRNTVEDASFSRPIVEKHNSKGIIVVTSDYHVPRARFLFKKEFSKLELSMVFIGVFTDRNLCEFDLDSQIAHEKTSLERLKRESELKGL